MGTELHYRPGSFYRICDMTGFATRAERTRKEWNNLIVRTSVWEARQPQDFVTGVRDDQTVPEPRPRQTDSFQGPLTTQITASGSIGDVSITVENTLRMYAGDTISVTLDNGAEPQTSINKVVSTTQLIIRDPLAWSVSPGNVIVNYSAISPPNIG